MNGAGRQVRVIADDAAQRAEHDGKMRYETRRGAKAAKRKLMRDTGHVFNVYRCRWCEWWHVGCAERHGREKVSVHRRKALES